MLIKNVPLAFPTDSYSTIQRTPRESPYCTPRKKRMRTTGGCKIQTQVSDLANVQ